MDEHKHDEGEVSEKNTEIHKSSTKIEIDKFKLWRIISVILGILLVLSLVTSGFGLGIDVFSKSEETQNQDTTPSGNLEDNEITGDATAEAVPINIEGISTEQGNPFLEIPDAEICKTSDGKPIVRLFSTTWCMHCNWVKTPFHEAIQPYIDNGDIKVYHWQLDENDNELTDDIEDEIPDTELAIYKEFNPQGTIPTFVFGCKYFRVGSGHEYDGENGDPELEKEEYELLIEHILSETQA